VKVYESKDIRNVGVVGHGDSGKTTLTAGLLFSTGATNRLLRVDEGNTITDFDEEEIQRKISISTAIAAAEWKKAKINILDTPGYNIFINDTRAALVAADAVLVVVDGVAGVEVQTEKVWQFANDFTLPRAVIINKLDRDRADFQRAIKFLQLSDQLQSSADAKFLLGASAFSLGQSAVNDANDKKSCDLARMARDAFNLASINLPAGGQKYPTEAAQLLTAIPQFTPAVDNEVKRFCK